MVKKIWCPHGYRVGGVICPECATVYPPALARKCLNCNTWNLVEEVGYREGRCVTCEKPLGDAPVQKLPPKIVWVIDGKEYEG